MALAKRREAVITYVDGFNLYFGIRDAGLHTSRWLDVRGVCEAILKPGQHLSLVRYFTANVRDNPQKVERQATYLDALRARGNLAIDLGLFQTKTMTCRSCGNEWRTYDEKRTDVNLAVRLLNDAHDDRFDTALIVSADSDLVPVVHSIRKRFPTKRVVFAAPPKRWSTALAEAAHAAIRVSRATIRANPLPDPVITHEGVELQAPAGWLPETKPA